MLQASKKILVAQIAPRSSISWLKQQHWSFQSGFTVQKRVLRMKSLGGDYSRMMFASGTEEKISDKSTSPTPTTPILQDREAAKKKTETPAPRKFGFNRYKEEAKYDGRTTYEKP